MPAQERWREHGQPPVRTLIITIHETVKGLDGLLARLAEEGRQCDLSAGLHLDATAHKDRPTAHAQVTRANVLLQEATAKIQEAIRQLSHSA